MRLLRLEPDGEFRLVEYFGKNIPRYAILSHTWGADGEEVTYKDLADGVEKSKPGYVKLRFCGNQAAKDGLQFFWVDTCCIDKSSSAELSEAINSMFRWYNDAAKCYVYLTDLTIGHSTKNNVSSQRRSDFRRSRWFTRSWTLQELIAPASVEFFSAEGERLGDKNLLVNELHNITGISIEALQGRPLSQFGVDERMSWAGRREAKREEDTAYSLLGIFDIHMPLIYGEGRRKAFMRLHREIEQSLKNEQPVLPPTRIGESSSTVSFGEHPDYVSRTDTTTRTCEACAVPAADVTKNDSAASQPPRAVDVQVGELAISSFHRCGHGLQFNAYGGTQNNNSGSGNQFLGSFSGPVSFG